MIREGDFNLQGRLFSRVCVTAALGAASLVAGSASASGSTLPIPPATAFGMRVVVLHNRVRSAAGVAPIVWDRGLAAAAEGYAAELARTGRWGHSAKATR